MKDRNLTLLILSIFLFVLGFLLPLWEISATGVALAALGRRSVVAVVGGMLMDSIYGVPVGHLHALPFPFTSFAFLVILLRIVASHYVFTKAFPERL